MGVYDAIVVGGGFGGCVTAGLLARLGKRILLVESGEVLGGRVQSIEYEGYTLDLGHHFIEDTGSGICRIFEFLGDRIEVGAVSDSLPVWVDGKWIHIGERLKGKKAALKSIIGELVESDYASFDGYDQLPLRHWMTERGADQAVIDYFEFLAALEQITGGWFDHSASENLYVRKLHYEEKGMAGYSFWPKGGYRELFRKLQRVIEGCGGKILTQTEVTQILVEKERVLGVIAAPKDRVPPNEYHYGEVIEAPCVISTLPVWTVRNVLPPGILPGWYEEQITNVAKDEHKACWIGLYAGSDHEPIIAKTQRELCAWERTPRVACPGFACCLSNYDETVAPPGKHLFVCGFSCRSDQIKDRAWLRKTFHDIETDLESMYPAFRNTAWRKKHVVYNPPFGVQGKPGVVGRFRPDFVAPNVEGLYFVSDTFRGRGVGIDKVSRTALSCVERINGERIPFFESTWRY